MAEHKESRPRWVARLRDRRRLKREGTGLSAEAAHEQRKASTEYDPEKSAKVGEQMLGGSSGA